MDISKLHNGVRSCPIERIKDFMPEVQHIIDTFPHKNKGDWYCDIKVHMLKKGMFPCIPNWHYDLVPRDEKGKQDFSKVDTKNKMYFWQSGGDAGEWEDGRKIKMKFWNEFSQMDLHRGVPATDNYWRLFIRIFPKKLLRREKKDDEILTKQIQVYIPTDFNW